MWMELSSLNPHWRPHGPVLVQCCTRGCVGSCPNLVCSAGEVHGWGFFGSTEKGRDLRAVWLQVKSAAAWEGSEQHQAL